VKFWLDTGDAHTRVHEQSKLGLGICYVKLSLANLDVFNFRIPVDWEVLLEGLGPSGELAHSKRKIGYSEMVPMRGASESGEVTAGALLSRLRPNASPQKPRATG
jgi:hypothetical protein